MMKKSLSWRAHAGALLVLGLPIIGSNLMAFFIHATDTVMLGWYGVDDLAAIVLAGAFWFLTFILGSGFGHALSPVVAAARAQNDEVQVRRATRMTIWLTLIYGVLVAPVFLFSETLFLKMGQSPEVARLASTYLLIAGWSIIPGLITNALRAYLAALGKPGVALLATIAGFVLHAVLNWMLIFGNWGAPELGIAGAAISTLCSDLMIALILLTYAVKRFPEFALLQRFWKADWQMFRRMFGLGWPVSVQLVAEVGLFTSASVMMGWISAETLAAHGIALQLASTTFLVHLGLAHAATIRAGHAAGLRNAVDLRDGALVAVVMSGLFALVAISIFLAIPEPMLRLFLDPENPRTAAVVAAGLPLMFMAALFQMADGGQAMTIGLLRGLQDTKVPMYIATFGYWVVGLPVAYLSAFTFGFGGTGVWIGLTASLVVVWAALSWRFWNGRERQLLSPV